MALPTQRLSLTGLDEIENEAELIAHHIGPDSTAPGRAYARLTHWPYSVAFIIGTLQLEHGSVANTARTLDIPDEAVQAAIAWYRRYPEYIDARNLIENDWFRF